MAEMNLVKIREVLISVRLFLETSLNEEKISISINNTNNSNIYSNNIDHNGTIIIVIKKSNKDSKINSSRNSDNHKSFSNGNNDRSFREVQVEKKLLQIRDAELQ